MRGFAVALIMVALACPTWLRAADAEPRNFNAVNAHSAIGETGHLYLLPSSFYVHPFYNDMFGSTDKYLSGAFKMGRLWMFSSSSAQLAANWMFLTPAWKKVFGSAWEDKPEGRFADWANVVAGYAHVFRVGDARLKNEFHLAGNHVGPHGADKVHRAIHEVSHNDVEHLQYTDQPEGYFAGVGWRLARILTPARVGLFTVQAQPSLYGFHDRFMGEASADLNVVAVARPLYWEMGFELRVVRQFESEIYDDPRAMRYEAAMGTLLLSHFKPTVKYVSAYLSGDRVGQTYFDLLGFVFPL